jgi:hypothetical protein
LGGATSEGTIAAIVRPKMTIFFLATIVNTTTLFNSLLRQLGVGS